MGRGKTAHDVPFQRMSENRRRRIPIIHVSSLRRANRAGWPAPPLRGRGPAGCTLSFDRSARMIRPLLCSRTRSSGTADSSPLGTHPSHMLTTLGSQCRQEHGVAATRPPGGNRILPERKGRDRASQSGTHTDFVHFLPPERTLLGRNGRPIAASHALLTITRSSTTAQRLRSPTPDGCQPYARGETFGPKSEVWHAACSVQD